MRVLGRLKKKLGRNGGRLALIASLTRDPKRARPLSKLEAICKTKTKKPAQNLHNGLPFPPLQPSQTKQNRAVGLPFVHDGGHLGWVQVRLPRDQSDGAGE
jgi:hypothetical protein